MICLFKFTLYIVKTIQAETESTMFVIQKIERRCFFALASYMISTFLQITQKNFALTTVLMSFIPTKSTFPVILDTIWGFQLQKLNILAFLAGRLRAPAKKRQKSNFSTSESRGIFWAVSWDHNGWNTPSNLLPQSSSLTDQGFDCTSTVGWCSGTAAHFPRR